MNKVRELAKNMFREGWAVGEFQNGFRFLFHKNENRHAFKHGIQKVHTPFDLCEQMVSKVLEHTDMKDKRVLVIFNGEFLPVLIRDHGIQSQNITFVSDSEAESTYVRCIFPEVTIIEEYKPAKEYTKEEKVLSTVKNQFDVIFMNPPYSVKPRPEAKENIILWDKFVQVAHSLTKDNGYLCNVHPTGWREPYAVKFKPINDLLLRNIQLEYLEVHNALDGKKTFGADTAYDWYIAKKCPPTRPTVIRYLDGTEDSVNLSKLPFIPNYMAKDVLALVAKDGEERVDLLYSRSAYEREKVSRTQSETHIHPIVDTIGTKDNLKLWWSSFNNEGHFGTPKVIFSNGRSSGTLCDLKGEYGMTQFAYAIVDDPKNLPFIQKAITSPKFREIMKACALLGGNRYNHKVISVFRKDFWKEFI